MKLAQDYDTEVVGTPLASQFFLIAMKNLAPDIFRQRLYFAVLGEISSHSF
jgi:hypothetical protein